MKRHRPFAHATGLVALNLALFLPLIGGGFVHDDFMWLYNVAYRPSWYGLTHPVQTFYNPLTWLSFKLDWTLWGFNAFPIATENLLLHIANILLLYRLARRLWRSHVAAWWAACGFALFYMANSWAVMWISARTHLLATFFCLAAMLAAARFAQAERRKGWAGLAVLACCALSMLAKEVGVASVAAVVLVCWYTGGAGWLRDNRASAAVLFIALAAILSAYLALRTRAGAVSISSNEGWYQYAFEWKVFFSNLREYLERTFLLAAWLGGAAALSQKLRGGRPTLNALTRREVIFCVMLFTTMIAPVILIRGRSGLYTYLPGLGAALLLGAASRSLSATLTVGELRRLSWLNASPVILTVIVLSVATVGQSWKWRRMAQTNTAVLSELARLNPRPEPDSQIILWYAARDDRHRFPDGFGTWSFPFALKLLYREPNLRGEIVSEGKPFASGDGGREVHYLYTVRAGRPHISKQQ